MVDAERWFTTREELDKFVAEQEAQTGEELAVTDHPVGAQAVNGHAAQRLTIVELHEVRSLNNQLAELAKMGLKVTGDNGFALPKSRCADADIRSSADGSLQIIKGIAMVIDLLNRMLDSVAVEMRGRRKCRRSSRRKAELLRRLPVESLEHRLCLSSMSLSSTNSYYQYDQIAQAGQAGIVSIEPAASINDLGQTAFVANQASGQSIYVGNGTAAPKVISFATASSNRTYGQELQINNASQVAAVDTVALNGTFSQARIWTAANPGVFTIIANASTPRINSTYFDAIASFTSISNDGKQAFAGLSGTNWDVGQSASHVNNGAATVATLSTPAFFRVKAANGGLTLVSDRQGTTTSIVLYGAGSPISIATTATGGGWSSLGIRPGISADGDVIVFEGQRAGAAAPGIWASIEEANGLGRKLVQIAGQGIAGGAELGHSALPNPTTGAPGGNALFFSAFDADNQLSVYHEQSGPLAPGDSFVVSFMGTPNAASSSSYDQGIPFAAADGLWTEQVYADKPIVTGGTEAIHTNIAIPVVQIGTNIGGATVQSIAAVDSLGGAMGDRDGNLRAATTQGDHMVAFEVSTSAGEMVLRATHFDLSVSQLTTIMPTLSAGSAAQYINALNRAMTEFAITTPQRQAAFLAQVARESSQLQVWQENLNYSSVQRLRSSPFGSKFVGLSDSVVSQYVNNPQQLANFVYANTNGNGNVASGDGYTYRGQGPLQITFKNNYTIAGAETGYDLVHNPTLLSDHVNHPEVGLLAAASYFSTRHATSSGYSGTLNQIADHAIAGSSQTVVSNVNKAITFGVSGSTADAANRLPYFTKALAALGVALG